MDISEANIHNGRPRRAKCRRSDIQEEPEKGKDCSGLRTGTARTLPGVLVSTLGVPSSSGDSYASLPKLVKWQIKGLL